MNGFTHRLARMDDLEPLRALMRRAIAELQRGFLTPEQIRTSHKVMGLDTQLVQDQTYFLVEKDGVLAGCGGWSFRATLYGGDDSAIARQPARLDPATDAARVRAMYTDPAFARQGVGSLIIGLCEAAAQANGFQRAELMATLSGEPLYRRLGYVPVEYIQSAAFDGVRVPLIRMGKTLRSAAPRQLGAELRS
ncbi:MAG TPA: GNAT family N-acetyltransferase [Sphingomonas sp.]|nr:GNAT family N-acetyltransferase [Sphingomonas sp.]